MERVLRIFRDEFRGKIGKKVPELIPHETDILIIGGGVIGTSIAYWLKKRAPNSFNVTVIEKDPTYANCSTTRSVGGVRQQFSLKENIQMSLFGAEFLRDYKMYLGEDAPDPQFNHEGYLFLAETDEGAVCMEDNAKLQRELGARIELLTADTLHRRFPFISNEGIKLASYGLQNEGWFDPWSLLCGMKNYALKRQVGYLNAELVDFRFRSIHNTIMDGRKYEPTNHAIVKLPSGELKEIIFGYLIITAGAQSGAVGRLLNMGEKPGILSTPIPVEPRKRYVYTFHAPDAPAMGFPFLVDSSGTYCRREGIGGHYICGKSPDREDETSDMDLENIDYTPFEEEIWPTLAKRAPSCFENIKPGKAWAGFYDYNYLDENAIVGKHPYYHHVLIATGFSGHGLQMAPAVGRAVQELLIDGEYMTVDLSRFSFDRVLANEPIREQAIV